MRDRRAIPDMSSLYNEMAIQTLIGRIERDLPDKSLEGTEFEMAVNLISTYSRKHIVSSIMQPKDDISMQLKELITIDMFIALFLNPH